MTDLEHYLNTLAPMQRAKAKAALEMFVRHNGKALMTRNQIIEARVNDGNYPAVNSTPNVRKTTRRRDRPDFSRRLGSAAAPLLPVIVLIGISTMLIVLTLARFKPFNARLINYTVGRQPTVLKNIAISKHDGHFEIDFAAHVFDKCGHAWKGLQIIIGGAVIAVVGFGLILSGSNLLDIGMGILALVIGGWLIYYGADFTLPCPSDSFDAFFVHPCE